MGADIPATTKFMLDSGTFIRDHPVTVALGMVFGIVALKFVLRLDVVRSFIGLIMLRTPILGELLRKLAFSRALRSIATLLAGNVSLMNALDHGARVAGNQRVKAALLQARTGVEHGGNLSDSLAETRMFPAMLVQIVAVGERTGRLGPLLSSTAARMEDEVDARLKALVSIIEPIMIVFMGTIVGTITLSIIGPIYSVVQNIK
jgi:type IV pilus assembly protein PilC